MEQAKRRLWADVAVMIVAVFTVAQAIWGPALLTQASQDRGASSTWVMALIAGGVAIAGLIVSQRRPNLGRGLVAFAGGFILVGPFTYQRAAPIAMTFAIVSGIILLVAAKFIGPMPPPTQSISPPAPPPPTPPQTRRT